MPLLEPVTVMARICEGDSAGKLIAVRGEASGVPGKGSTSKADDCAGEWPRPCTFTGTAKRPATASASNPTDSFLISASSCSVGPLPGFNTGGGEESRHLADHKRPTLSP